METTASWTRKSFDWRILVPMSLTLTLLVADQITKALIVAHVPINTIWARWWQGWLWIVHERNLGMALSIGNGAPNVFHLLVIKLVPLSLIIAATIYYFRASKLNWYQRWTLASILAGGLGNLIDRFFRPAGVVDFISVKFFGVFGWERFPTFNVADASVSVGAVLLFSSLLFGRKHHS